MYDYALARAIINYPHVDLQHMNPEWKNRAAYTMLTHAATRTDRSRMNPTEHGHFLTIIDRAQTIIRLELEQMGERRHA